MKVELGDVEALNRFTDTLTNKNNRPLILALGIKKGLAVGESLNAFVHALGLVPRSLSKLRTLDLCNWSENDTRALSQIASRLKEFPEWTAWSLRHNGLDCEAAVRIVSKLQVSHALRAAFVGPH